MLSHLDMIGGEIHVIIPRHYRREDTCYHTSTLAYCSLTSWGSSPDRVKPKTVKLVHCVFVASALSTHHFEERAKIGWLGIRIMCPIWAMCLSADCCFSELAHKTKHVGLEQSGPHRHLI